MVDPATYRPAAGTIPTSPGVYRFVDARNRVIYVGKAKNLRNRLNSYFANPDKLLPRTYQMVHAASSVRWTVVGTENEALQLEYTWIKQFDPRFNVVFRDDSSYPMLSVTVAEEFPRLSLYRGSPRKGVRYFGPYTQAWIVREIQDLITKAFPIRTCSTGVFRRHVALGRPCLLGYIDKCSAPCVGKISQKDHRELTRQVCRFLAGHTDEVVRQLRVEMMEASDSLDFERAAGLRDHLQVLDKVMERQAIVFLDQTDADVIAFATDELEVAVQVFHVRGGRVRGQRSWVVERSAETEISHEVFSRDKSAQDRSPQEQIPEGHDAAQDPTIPVLVESFLMQFYGGMSDSLGSLVVDDTDDSVRTDSIPRLILVPALPDDSTNVEEWLSGMRGSRVEVRMPQRGDKRDLQNTVQKNAEDALRLHKLKRVGDLTARSAALEQLQEALGFDSAPLRIECTDISHVSGTDVVASLVVFEDGLPRKSDYRRYTIREAAGNGHSDDVASIAEVTYRRFRRYRNDILAVPEDNDEFLAPHPEVNGDALGEPNGASTLIDPTSSASGSENDGTGEIDDSVSGKKTRFAYPPQLFIVDGGAPQVAAADNVLTELGITDVALCGLAKRLEEVWLPGEDDPVILPRNSEALFLLQRIRDEAHRFAITFHRSKRSKRLRFSELDAIPGLGEKRKKALLRHFGSVVKVKSATAEDIESVVGIGPQLARTIVDSLHDGVSGSNSQLADLPGTSDRHSDAQDPDAHSTGVHSLDAHSTGVHSPDAQDPDMQNMAEHSAEVLKTGVPTGEIQSAHVHSDGTDTVEVQNEGG